MSSSADEPPNSDNAATDAAAGLIVAPTPTADTDVVALVSFHNEEAVTDPTLVTVANEKAVTDPTPVAVANGEAVTDPTPVTVGNEEAVTNPTPRAVANEETVTDPATVTVANRLSNTTEIVAVLLDLEFTLRPDEGCVETINPRHYLNR